VDVMPEQTFNGMMEARLAKLEKMVWLLVGLQAPQLLSVMSSSGLL